MWKNIFYHSPYSHTPCSYTPYSPFSLMSLPLKIFSPFICPTGIYHIFLFTSIILLTENNLNYTHTPNSQSPYIYLHLCNYFCNYPYRCQSLSLYTKVIHSTFINPPLIYPTVIFSADICPIVVYDKKIFLIQGQI